MVQRMGWKYYWIFLAVKFTFKEGLDANNNAYDNNLYAWKVGTGSEFFGMAYVDHFKRMIDINVKGTDRIGALGDNNCIDLDVYWSDWEEVLVLYDILSTVHEGFYPFRTWAEGRGMMYWGILG